MAVERFTDLVAWQKARALNRDIYNFTRRPSVERDRAYVSQIRRASVSIMSNIAEGFERGGRSEFHQFLSVAKASSAEVHSLLYVAVDVNYFSSTEFQNLQSQVEEIGRIIGGLRVAVARQRDANKTSKST